MATILAAFSISSNYLLQIQHFNQVILHRISYATGNFLSNAIRASIRLSTEEISESMKPLKDF